MQKTYSEILKSSRYKLAGHGNRNIGALMESLQNMDPSVDSDVYGTGDVIKKFGEEIANLLGKEKAVFFPSGTMAQQIALRICSDDAKLKKVAYHPLCHLEIHEKDGLKKLHHLEPVLLGESNRLFTLEDIKSIELPISCHLIELPQREIGGQLPSFKELTAISEFCKANNIKLHLDGARLFEALPYYNKSAEDICALFDSVYVSFYKGLGGIAGAMLAGSAYFIEEAKVWKRRHGGDLISLYPYIISAKYYMDRRIDKMNEYWDSATALAERFNSIEGIKTIPEVPVCNMFHVYFSSSKENLEKIFADIVEKYDLGISMNLKEIEPCCCKCEISLGDSFSLIPDEVLDKAFALLGSELGK